LGLDESAEMRGNGGRRKGIVLTVDALVALLVLFVTVSMAYSMINSLRTDPPPSMQLRHLSLDALTIMEKQHYMQEPLNLVYNQSTNTSGLREFLFNTPPSICMDIEAYSNDTPGINYTYSKENCARTAGEYQVAWRSFMIHRNTTNFSYDEYYTVKMTSWYKENIGS
jgi:hypothetical protein